MKKIFPYAVVVLFLIIVFSVWGYRKVSEWQADRQPPTVEHADDATPHVEKALENPDGQSASDSQIERTAVEEDGGRQDDKGFLRGVSGWFKEFRKN